MKEFNEFVKKGIIVKQSINKSRAKDLIEESERKYNSLKQLLDKIGLDNENANDVIEYCYDVLIGLIRAKLYLEGFKASGEGAHEAEVSYLSKLNFSENEVRFIDDLRYFRNGVKYYGRRFDKEYAEKVLKFLKEIRPRLLKSLS